MLLFTSREIPEPHRAAAGDREDSDTEPDSASASADTSLQTGFLSANTSLLSDYRANDTGETSDADSFHDAEATDHDLSFDGELRYENFIPIEIFPALRKISAKFSKISVFFTDDRFP